MSVLSSNVVPRGRCDPRGVTARLIRNSVTRHVAQAQQTRKQSKAPFWGAVVFTLAAILGLSTLFYRSKYGHPTSDIQRIGKLPGERESCVTGAVSDETSTVMGYNSKSLGRAGLRVLSPNY